MDLYRVRRRHKGQRKPLIGSDAVKVPDQTIKFTGDKNEVSTYIDSNVTVKWQGKNGSVTGGMIVKGIISRLS